MRVTAAVLSRFPIVNSRQWDDVAAVAFLIVFVTTIYAARLGTQPIVGEESRWATGAREMLATGDWVVPRQQGQVFPERPPMTMWAMAAVGWLRGEVDTIAIRLPSVLAIVLTTLTIFLYGRAVASPFLGLVAAIIYATFGQVLQIGRLGESEALFAFFISASLLLWHLAYLKHWPQLAMWSTGFSLAALGALVKGPQAPVYFVAITGIYLLIRGDWRLLLRWQYAVGMLAFAAIVSLWQVPFWFATDWHTVRATWSGLAADRIHFGGLVKHVLTYPLETFACLLPWAPLLVALAKRETRDLLRNDRMISTFLFTAVLVAYPTVWLATGARGRYFMPLYPIVALLIALIIERCSTAPLRGYPRRAWHQFLLLNGTLIGIGTALLVVGRFVGSASSPLKQQPIWLCLLLMTFAIASIVTLVRSYRWPHRYVPMIAVFAISAFIGVAYLGAVINVNVARWNNPAPQVARWREHLPAGTQLVSFAPIEHRFAYYYSLPIVELPWPRQLSDLPTDVEYFCFMRTPGDTAERRAAGRGRTWTTTPGTLPFAWQEIGTINAERSLKDQRTVVLGRVVRPLQAEISDATRPQLATASRAADANHK